MVTFEQSQKQELDNVLEEAEKFHGHLGPFLVLGVRMGLIGVREVKAKENNNKLRVTATLKYSVPFSCIIDGIQVATKCTIGNKKLELTDSSGITTEFEIQNKRKVTVALNPATFSRLKNKMLSKDVSPEDTRKLALMVASMPEEELFIIGSK